MKCLILGGGGFIGSHLCEALLAAGHPVRVFERPGVQSCLPPPLAEQVEGREGDSTNPVDIKAALAGCDTIFHLISTTLPKTSNDNPVYDLQTNLIPLVQILECLRHHPGPKVIFVSSGGTVYGKPTQTPIPESHPTEPLCAYGITKLASEKYLSMYRELYGVPSVILRLANPFGERQRATAAQGAIAVFLHKALAGETIEIWGDGEIVRDYLYVKDAVRALALAMTYGGAFHVFNIGSSRGLSLNSVLHEIDLLIGRPLSTRYVAARSFDVPENVLDITRAGVELGWQPTTSFQAGLGRTVRWLQDAAPRRTPTQIERELPAHEMPELWQRDPPSLPAKKLVG